MANSLTTPKLTPTLSFWLDCVRGVAAMLVMVGHARQVMYGNYGTDFAGAPDVVVKVFFVLAGMGTQAVMCFFVMSGLLIGPKFLNSRALTPDYLADYAIARLARIWIVALPALILAFVVAKLSMDVLGASHSYWDDSCDPTLGNLAANAVFLNKAFVPTLCANGPYWSIHNEMVYYALWPAIIYALFCKVRWLRLAAATFAIALTAALAAFDAFNLHNTLTLFAIWVAGALCLAAPRPPGGFWFWAVVSAIVIVGTNLVQFHWTIEAVLMTIPLVCFFRTAQDADQQVPAKLRSFFKWLADISFSLYLTHAVLLNLVRTLFDYAFGLDVPFRHFDAFNIALFVGSITLALAFAQAFHWLFERHTDKFRHLLQMAFRRDQRALST